MANSIAVVKVCPQHGDLTAGGITVWKYKTKTYRRCKQCIKDKNDRYYAKKRVDPKYIAQHKARNAKRWVEQKAELSAKRKTPEAITPVRTERLKRLKRRAGTKR